MKSLTQNNNISYFLKYSLSKILNNLLLPNRMIVSGILVGLFGIIFRFILLRSYSDLPTGFDGSIAFRYRYLLEHGTFLNQNIKTYSYWSAGVNSQLGDYFMDIVNAIVLKISILTSLESRLIHQIILTITLIGFSSFVLNKGKAYQQSIFNSSIIFGIITLGSPVVIQYLTGWNASYGWILLMILTSVSISDIPDAWKKGLSFFIVALGPTVYHTFGFLLVSYVVILWIIGRITGCKISIVSPLTIIIYYFTYQIFISVQFFGELVTGIADVVTFAFLLRETQPFAVSSPNVGLVDLRYFHLVLYGLLAMPIAISFVRLLRIIITRPARDNEYNNLEIRYWVAAVSLGLAVGFFAVMFGLKAGVDFLINRGASYLSIPAVLAIIAEMRYRPRGYQYIYPIAIIVLAMSLYSFSVQASTVLQTHYLTSLEAEGYIWLREHIQEQDVVFTDFRMSGPFIADGHFRVVGITGQKDEQTAKLLQEIYYASTPSSITSAINQIRTYHEDQSATYLFLSSKMTGDFPGVTGFGTIYAPMPKGIFHTIDLSKKWDLVYNNDQIFIYKRK